MIEFIRPGTRSGAHIWRAQHRRERHRVATMSGDFDAPCSACGACPSVLLIEWSAPSAGSPEWQYFCRDHAGAAVQDWIDR
jgi:hypothetical protein